MLGPIRGQLSFQDLVFGAFHRATYPEEDISLSKYTVSARVTILSSEKCGGTPRTEEQGHEMDCIILAQVALPS